MAWSPRHWSLAVAGPHVPPGHGDRWIGRAPLHCRPGAEAFPGAAARRPPGHRMGWYRYRLQDAPCRPGQPRPAVIDVEQRRRHPIRNIAMTILSDQVHLKPDDLASYWMPFTANRQFKSAPRMLVKAQGMYYWDDQGRKVLDGFSGMWCCNLGHNHPRVVEAIRSQAAVLDYAP